MKYLKHKPGSIEEIVSKLRPEDSEYQAKFKKGAGPLWAMGLGTRLN